MFECFTSLDLKPWFRLCTLVLDSRRGWEGAWAETAAVLCALAYIFRPVPARLLQAHTGNVPTQFIQ